VTKTQIVDHSVLARTTSVLTPAVCPVARGPSVPCRTTWLSVGVPGELLGTLLGTAGGLQGMRFVLLVEQTQTVRLARMTGLFVAASQHILETHCKAVVTNVTLTVIVGSHKLVTASTTGVRMLVAGGPAERTLTARLLTTVPSAPALLTSWEIPSPGATLSAPDTMTAPLTRPV